MELVKVETLKRFKLPELNSVIEVMQDAVKQAKESGVYYATPSPFPAGVVNEPVALAMLEVGVDVALLDFVINTHPEYVMLWADAYNMASMEKQQPEIGYSIGFLLSEFDKYLQGKNVWHNVETFSKFLNI